MRRIITQVEIIEENDGMLRLIFQGKHGGRYRTMLPFATRTARSVNKDLYFAVQAILREDHPGAIEGRIVNP